MDAYAAMLNRAMAGIANAGPLFDSALSAILANVRCHVGSIYEVLSRSTRDHTRQRPPGLKGPGGARETACLSRFSQKQMDQADRGYGQESQIRNHRILCTSNQGTIAAPAAPQ